MSLTTTWSIVGEEMNGGRRAGNNFSGNFRVYLVCIVSAKARASSRPRSVVTLKSNKGIFGRRLLFAQV